MKKSPPISAQMRQLQIILLILTLLTIFHLFMTGSMVGLIGAILILIMVWGIRKGDYPLTRGLSVFLFLYGGSNLLVLFLALIFGGTVSVSAGLWLAIYSIAIITLGIGLRSRPLQTYLKSAPQPQEKEKKITFFRGGWRDL